MHFAWRVCPNLVKLGQLLHLFICLISSEALQHLFSLFVMRVAPGGQRVNVIQCTVIYFFVQNCFWLDLEMENVDS